MDYNIVFDEEQNSATLTPAGSYRFSDFKKLILKYLEDPRYRPSFQLMIDLRFVDYTPTVNEIMELNKFLIGHKAHFNNKTALLVSSEFSYDIHQLSRKNLLHADFDFELFLDENEALDWINLQVST